MNHQLVRCRLRLNLSQPALSTPEPLRTLLHPLAFIVRPALTLASKRYYSQKESPLPTTNARPTLTLDDVLPAPSSPSAPVPSRTTELPESRLNRYSQPEANQTRPSLRSYGAMRSSFDFSSDPILRRSGERTIYSLIVRTTANNTRLTLTHTPLSDLPGSWPGNIDYQEAFPLAGAVVARVTAGSVGFKRGKRQEYEAATQATLAMFAKIRELVAHGPDPNFAGISALLGSSRLSPPSSRSMDMTKRAVKEGLPRELEIVFDGFGNGRDAFMSSLMGAQGAGIRELVRSVRDKTVVKIGGSRAKKRRRV